MALFTGDLRNATVVCTQVTEVLTLNRRDFVKACEASPEPLFKECIEGLKRVLDLDGWPTDHIPKYPGSAYMIATFKPGMVICCDLEEIENVVVLLEGKCKVLTSLEWPSSNKPHLLKVASDLHTHHLSISQKISQLKRKQIELSHRVLKLLAKQTVVRRAGFAISADEEALRNALEHIWTELTSPRGLRARIQQLLPTLRSSNALDSKLPTCTSTSAVDAGDKKSVSDVSSLMTAAWWQQPEIVEDLKEYLDQRNNGIKEMRSLLMDLTNTLRVLTEKKSKLSALPGFHAAADLAPVRSSPFGPPLRLV
nr:unnamed protein product [Spirometra erinaceieuropaei]